jgi:hypothetical protein
LDGQTGHEVWPAKKEEPMVSDEVRRVLGEIFDETGGIPDLQPKQSVLFGSFEDTIALAELLAADSSEEELQRLLTQRPQILLGAFGYAQNTDLAFLTKPPIGTQFKADFGILSFDQGGCTVHLVEIERANAQLFTQADTPARDLQTAMGQSAIGTSGFIAISRHSCAIS